MGRISSSVSSALTTIIMIQSAASEPAGASAPAWVGADLRLVGQRGLVPMMAVGDEQRLAPEIARAAGRRSRWPSSWWRMPSPSRARHSSVQARLMTWWYRSERSK